MDVFPDCVSTGSAIDFYALLRKKGAMTLGAGGYPLVM